MLQNSSAEFYSVTVYIQSGLTDFLIYQLV